MLIFASLHNDSFSCTYALREYVYFLNCQRKNLVSPSFSVVPKGEIHMRHPYEKFIRLELITLTFVVIVGLIAIFKGYLIIILFSLFMLAISILCEALIAINTYHTSEGVKQFIKAVMLLLLTAVLLFQL